MQGGAKIRGRLGGMDCGAGVVSPELAMVASAQSNPKGTGMSKSNLPNPNPSYTIRSAEGAMIAKVSAKIAREIVLRCDGEWRPYKTKEKGDTRAFHVKADMVYLFGLNPNDEATISVKLYLWEGYKMIEDVA